MAVVGSGDSKDINFWDKNRFTSELNNCKPLFYIIYLIYIY